MNLVVEKPQAQSKMILWALLVASLALGLFWQLGQQAARTWQAPQSIDIQIGEDYYRLDQSKLNAVRGLSSAHFNGVVSQSKNAAHEQITVQLDASFRAVEQRIPVFVDWYYSLNGEYSRLSMSILSRLNLSDEDYLSRRAAQILFPEQVWEATLEQLESNTNQRAQLEWTNGSETWLSTLQSNLSGARIGPPLEQGIGEPQSQALAVNSLMESLQTLAMPEAMTGRMAVSGASALGVAGPALWRAVVARNTVNSARLAAAEMAAVGASRGGSIAAGAAICSPGGPIAIACAAIAGAATWIATDWLLLSVDEAMNRQALEEALREGLITLRVGVEQELVQAYDRQIESWHSQSRGMIETNFSLVEADAEPLNVSTEI
ncbi:MAG: hypothetical protein R3332_13470 [Pseudohongiellaceae bacterium]|nr:hypothetical protein [Pseudohongiellaceae bacterium]